MTIADRGDRFLLALQGYVDASPEVVFQILINDLEEVPTWNPACEKFEVFLAFDTVFTYASCAIIVV